VTPTFLVVANERFVGALARSQKAEARASNAT